MQREGFVLGIGLGAGLGSWNIEERGGDGESSSNFSFATDFALGFSATPKIAIYYSQRTSWFSSEFTITAGEFGGPLTPQRVDRTLTQGFTGVGVTYFVRPRAPSLFLSGGFGVAWWAQVFEESTDCIKFPLIFPCLDVAGVGVSASAGYELHRRFIVEANVIWGDPVSYALNSGGRFEVMSGSAVGSFVARVRLF